jgi:hypothetical protein
MAVTVINAVFCDVTPCSSCKTNVSEERIVSIIRVTGISEPGTTSAVTSNRSTLRKKYYVSVLRLLVTVSIPSSPFLATLMMEPIRFSETSVRSRTIRRIIPEAGILHCVLCFTLQLNSRTQKNRGNFNDSFFNTRLCALNNVRIMSSGI